jgi:signal transduction histidine kinase
MGSSDHQNILRWIIVFASFIIVSLILWNTYIFFQNFKAEERSKMQNWTFAQTEFVDIEENSNVDLILQILGSNNTTPMIVLNNDGAVGTYNNVDSLKIQDPAALQKLINRFAKENTPIEVYYNGEVYQTLFYGNSPLLNKLKYYPVALILILVLFLAVIFFFYRSSKIATQNKLWSGMAKETAHQIGTPLSSLVGWTEILKNQNVDPSHITEIEKDITRLQTITDRFSKIGSIPKLETTNIVSATRESYDYLKLRSSKLIEFDFKTNDKDILVSLNKQLFSWTIENLVKNAIDAMKGKGSISIEIIGTQKLANILVRDTGRGISKKQFKKVFEPGYTSKKRGWGLGLSLAKRIVEDYHDGKIKVLTSESGIGTAMQITLKRL